MCLGREGSFLLMLILNLKHFWWTLWKINMDWCTKMSPLISQEHKQPTLWKREHYATRQATFTAILSLYHEMFHLAILEYCKENCWFKTQIAKVGFISKANISMFFHCKQHIEVFCKSAKDKLSNWFYHKHILLCTVYGCKYTDKLSQNKHACQTTCQSPWEIQMTEGQWSPLSVKWC